MIYLGYNRDLDSVAHFWRDSLRAFLFEKRAHFKKGHILNPA